jgi:hypothetical protein
MFQFCIDDSGTDQPPVFVLAGYLARIRNWGYFADGWQKVLRKKPQLAYLHAEEAFHRDSRQSQFNGWTRNQVNDRLLEFVGVIHKYKLNCVKVVISHADFDALIKIKHKNSPFKDPSNFTLAVLLLRALSYARSHKQREQLDFIFDEDVVKPGQLEEAYQIIINRLEPRDAELLPRKPSFKNDKEFVPLQAADLIAWHVRRDCFERANGKTLQSPVWDALQNIPTADFSWDRRDMLDIVKGLARSLVLRYGKPFKGE